MTVAEIPENAWWPKQSVLQVYPEVNPQVARIAVGALPAEMLEAKVKELDSKMGLAPVGNDLMYFYFMK